MPTSDKEFHASMWPTRDDKEVARLMVMMMDETFVAKSRGIIVPKNFSFTSYMEASTEDINTHEVAANLLEQLKTCAAESSSYSNINATVEKPIHEKLLSVSFRVKARSWKEASVLSSELFTAATNKAGLSFDEEETSSLIPFYKMGTKLTL